jgi:hypothetical protein
VTYEDFIAQKRMTAPMAGIADPAPVNEMLFPFQRDIVRWALMKGKAAIWADCGLGKSPMALEWGRAVCEHTGGDVLILTPLAVAQQFKREGDKFGVPVTVCRERGDLRPGVNVANYERLGKLDGFDPAGVVIDESSILKDYTSRTRNELIERFARTPFRLACTATPAPNDHMELGNHAEFLGVMTRAEMLAMFFVHDGGSTQDWRLKGHGVRDFWRWVCTWAVNIRSPSDLGYDGSRFILPPLNIHEHVVAMGDDFARKQGTLFTVDARGLKEQREARKASLSDRIDMAASIVNAEPGEPWIVWTDLNDESSGVAEKIPGAIEVTGSDSMDAKEKAMADFTTGAARVIVSKPSIAGWGLNWQHCARVVFVGISHSFEAWYQAIRRSYRFGQTRPVECHVIVSEAERSVLANLKRKQADAVTMATRMSAETSEFVRADLEGMRRTFTDYKPTKTMTVPAWVGSEAA